MDQPASAAYDVEAYDTAGPPSRLSRVTAAVRKLFGAAPGAATAGASIVTIVERSTGRELFRHIEEVADDDEHLYRQIRADLASLTAAEFSQRWVD